CVDFAGSSPVSRRGINVVMNYTEAYTTYGVKVIVSPDVPNNEGAFRVLEIRAPEGSILNARPPAPVAARHVIGHFLPPVVARAGHGRGLGQHLGRAGGGQGPGGHAVHLHLLLVGRDRRARREGRPLRHGLPLRRPGHARRGERGAGSARLREEGSPRWLRRP